MDRVHYYKIIIVGNSSVGKTSLIQRYIKGKAPEYHMVTTGIDFEKKRLDINSDSVELQIYDTAGQEKFRSIVESYYRGSHGAFVVFALNDKSSFDNVSKWIQSLKDKIPNIDIVLIGNKSDLENEIVDLKGADHEIAEKYNIQYFKTSAMNGQNVDETFEYLAELVHAHARNLPVPNPNPNPNPNPESNPSQKCCSIF